jgi:Uma2 family endonuclease
MTIAERKVRATATRRARGIWSSADLACLPDQLSSRPIHWELWDGELVAVAPPGYVHGSVVSRIAALLTMHGEWETGGVAAAGDVGVIVGPERPQSVFGADVVFLTREQLPARRSPEGYLLTVPALIVEVRSKNDRASRVRAKVARYLKAGARVVWVVEPDSETVTVHRSGTDPVTLRGDDALTAEGIVPPLNLPVRRLFEGLE